MTSTADPAARPAIDATGQAILDAAADIIGTEDFDSLSMRRVAARAGVSLSTVVRHFGTKDALLAALVVQGGEDEEREAHRTAMEPGDVASAVHVVTSDYELAGAQLLHMLAQEHRFPALSELLDIGRRGHRAWVKWAFAPQLSDRAANRRARLEDLLVVGTDVYTWKLLRLDRGLGPRATGSAMTELCEALVRG